MNFAHFLVEYVLLNTCLPIAITCFLAVELTRSGFIREEIPLSGLINLAITLVGGIAFPLFLAKLSGFEIGIGKTIIAFICWIIGMICYVVLTKIVESYLRAITN